MRISDWSSTCALPIYADVAVIDGWHGAVLASGRSDASGLVQLPGSGELDPQLKRHYVSTRDSQHEPPGLRVTRGDDIALLPLASEFQIDTWRAARAPLYEWRRARPGNLRRWGTTGQETGGAARREGVSQAV